MNTDFPQTGENRQILEEASAWLIDFRLGEADAATHQNFARWLRRSPEHIRAYMEVSGAYARLPSAKYIPASDIERLIAHTQFRENVVALESGLLTRGDLHAAPARSSMARRRTVIMAGIAATLAFAVFGARLILNPVPTYETQTGEQRTLTLEDGSRIELNARSRVRVAFTRTRRNVELIAGQALFTVAKDPDRPFVVNSAGALVRAIGTQFDVYRKESGTTVTVLEGRVSLQSPPMEALSSVAPEGRATEARPSLLQSMELSAGEQAVITTAAIAKSHRANVVAATAWTQGQLEFDETPLSEATAEFNRYSRKPLVVESSSLNALRISGIYASTDTASLLLFLQSQPDLFVTETDTEIRLTRK